MSDDRTSDEATGLPPLHIIEPVDTIVLLAWDASEGIVHNPVTGESQAVRYLHVRGIGNDENDVITWSQCHIAVPVEHAVDVAAALAKGTTEDLGGG